MIAHRVHPGAEGWLAEELAVPLEPLCPGWFRPAAEPDVPCPPAFAAQSAPGWEWFAAPSVAAGAANLGGLLRDRLAGHEGPWRLHLSEGGPAGRRRLLAEALDAWLARKQRRLRRSRNPLGDGPWLPDEALVQAGLPEPGRGWLGVALPAERQAWRLSPFADGFAEVAEDRRPPSRAYLKLAEALRHLGEPTLAGARCVDLGGSPGGWTFVLAEAGAQVLAIDRSPLAPDLMARAGVDFLSGDAFAFAPAEPVDGLVSDVVAFPPRIAALLERWLTARWCRWFVVTMKFKGGLDRASLAAFRGLVDRLAVGDVRHLRHNKHEVTAWGRVRSVPPQGAEATDATEATGKTGAP